MTFSGIPNANQYTYWDGYKFLPEGVPFHVIMGDDPSISFLSRRDNTPDVQAWYNSHNITGGKLRLINPCFKTHLDFTTQLLNQASINIDIQGELSFLVNGGEIELYHKMKLNGDGGSSINNISGACNVVGYNHNGIKTDDDRLAGTTASLTGFKYVIQFVDQSNTVNFTDANNGQILTISSGGDGSAVGTYIVLAQDGIGLTTSSCFAVFQGGTIPTQPQSGLHWTFGAQSGTNGSIDGTLNRGVLSCIQLSLNTATRSSLNFSGAYKTHILISNANQSTLNGLWRCMGAENIDGYAYFMNYPAFDNQGHTAPATLPDFGISGSSGSPTVHYQFVTSAFRLEGNDITLSNFYVSNYAGVPIHVDQYRNLTARIYINRCAAEAFAGFAGALACELQGFEIYLTQCIFTAAGTGTGQPCVLVTNHTDVAQSGLIYFDKCHFFGSDGGGIVIQTQGPPLTTGSVYVNASITENLSKAFILVDPRHTGGVAVSEISIKDVILADQISGSMIDTLVVSTSNKISNIGIIRIYGECSVSPILGSGIVNAGFIDLKCSNSQELGTPQTPNICAEYTLENTGRYDVVLTNGPGSFAPAVEFGFDIPIPDPTTWNGLSPGTCVISFPNGLTAPHRIANNTSAIDGYIVPLLHSPSGSSFKQLISYNVVPQAGDYIVAGVWTQCQTTSAFTPINGIWAINWSGTDTKWANSGSSSLGFFDVNNTFTGGAWLYTSIISKVATAGSSTFFNFNVGTNTTTDLAVYNLWVKYVPVSSGIPEQEIIRWYRHNNRQQYPGSVSGNLGLDKHMSFDWGGRATLGSPISGQLATSANSMTFNGVSGLLDTMVTSSNADITIATTASNQIIGMKALSANRNITLPASPLLGQKVIIKDLDGSLASFNLIVNGNGHNIEGVSTLTLTNTNAGPRSSIVLYFISNTDGWIEV